MNLMEQVALRCEDVSHTYVGAVSPVLREVSLSFASGSLSALTGPSGSGKSTLLSILGLLFPPTLGDVWVKQRSAHGSRRDRLAARTSEFAWVLQGNNVLPGRTALDNVMVGCIGLGISRKIARQKAFTALHNLGLRQRVDQPVALLSGGELQRVTLARALVSEKPVILADEPTGQLDRDNTQMVCEALQFCAAAGRTVVLATHDEYVAETCDFRFNLIDGKVETACAR